MTVEFKNVGDKKETFTAECTGALSEEWLRSQVEPIVKSFCWCAYNRRQNLGYIHSGWELVGYYKIV